MKNWIEFIYGLITGMYIYLVYGANDWKYWITALFIAIISVSYHQLKTYLDSEDKWKH